MKTSIAVLVLIVAIGGFLFFKNKGSQGVYSETATTTEHAMDMGDMNASTTSPSTATSTTATSTTSTSGVKTFVVQGSNFAFSPKTLSVNKGDTVEIVFKNSGGFHDFKIDEFKAATKKINGGQEDTVRFVADKSGTFEYYCSVGEHRAMGMVGTLTVK
jgi:plastocyanin